MIIDNWAVQIENGEILQYFHSESEAWNFINSCTIEYVRTIRISLSPPFYNRIFVDDLPQEMPELHCNEILIVRDIPNEEIRRQRETLSNIERDTFLLGRWDFAKKDIHPNEEEIEKAKKLLMNCLDEMQQEELESFKTVTINTKIGLFRIVIGELDYSIPPAFNVLYKNTKYCAVISDEKESFPKADHLIAQILFIKTNPKKFLKTANKESSLLGV